MTRASAGGVIDLFVRAGLAKSKSEARRLVEQGGAQINGERISAATTVEDINPLPGAHLLLRKGARDYAVIKLEG